MPTTSGWRPDMTATRLPAAGLPVSDGDRARRDFYRMMRWIAVAAVAMVAGALWYLSLFGSLTLAMAIATTLGVLISVILGCGLFAAGFFSSKSGHDQDVADATRPGEAAAANAPALPDDLEPYRRTDLFTEATVPAALRRDHSTKAGSWGLIRVVSGRLRYRITDPRRPASETILTADGPPGIVEPTMLHAVEPDGPVSFHVEFLRRRAPAEAVTG